MDVFLGTALWGWGVARETALGLLDRFYEAGGRLIDTSANYPISKVVADFGVAPRIVSEWLAANPGSGLRVLHKIGSINNLGESETALAPSDIFLGAELGSGLFGDALAIVSIHWDNRESGDEIAATVEALLRLSDEGFDIGYSGVKRPDLYRQACGSKHANWWIQVKENASTQNARTHYAPHFPDARYLAYGINMGGVKLATAEEASSVELRGVQEPTITQKLRKIIADPKGLFPRPQNLNHLALALTWFNPALSGAILGPRNRQQLDDNIAYIAALENEASVDAWRELFVNELSLPC